MLASWFFIERLALLAHRGQYTISLLITITRLATKMCWCNHETCSRLYSAIIFTSTWAAWGLGPAKPQSKFYQTCQPVCQSPSLIAQKEHRTLSSHLTSFPSLAHLSMTHVRLAHAVGLAAIQTTEIHTMWPSKQISSQMQIFTFLVAACGTQW